MSFDVKLNPFLAAMGARITAQRIRMKRTYQFDPRYVPMTDHATRRHCYVHPQEIATHFELNTQDRSYKRPVCAGCAE